MLASRMTNLFSVRANMKTLRAIDKLEFPEVNISGSNTDQFLAALLLPLIWSAFNNMLKLGLTADQYQRT